MSEQLKAALNVMRRMPPASCETSLNGLINLVPDLTDELLQRIDQPLQVMLDPITGKQFVLCDYNRDGDSYRSPWSNQYFPDIEDGLKPSDELRKLEETFNFVFDAYRNLYYEGGFSSVYFWDIQEGNFAGCFLVQKDVEKSRGLTEGTWNSIHVLEAIEMKEEKSFKYKLTTTVIISMIVKNDELGLVDLSGNMTKQDTRELPLDNASHTHVANMGSMVEDMELRIRREIRNIYIDKTRTVLSRMRTNATGGPQMPVNFMGEMSKAMGNRKRVE